MKWMALLTLGVGSLAGLQIMMSEDLKTEDNSIAATALPLDLQTSKVDFETATFGLG